MPQFLYFKIMIELFLIYPLVEYGIKKKAKFIIIALVTLTIIFNLFNLSKYLITEVFEYIIFAAIGIYFAEYEKNVNGFLRKNKYKIRNSFIEMVILMCFTTLIERPYGFLNPVVTTFYSFTAMLGICYICYKLKALYAGFRCIRERCNFRFFHAQSVNYLFVSSIVASAYS